MSNLDDNKTEILDYDNEYYDDDYIEDEEDKKKKRRVPLLLKFLLFFIVLLLAVLGAGYYYFTSCQKPIQETSEVVTFEIEENSTIMTVANKLEEAGLVKDARMTYYYARLNELTNIYMGEYNLDKSWDLEHILTTLNDPLAANQNVVNVTIVEGDWCKHIAKKLSDNTDTTYDDYVKLWNDKEWIRSLMSDYPFLTEDIFNNEEATFYLEGYLNPDTYQFKKDSTPEEITLKILDETRLIYLNYKDDIEASSLSTHELYSLASMLQYEAGGQLDAQKEISGIFYNRIKDNMKLESSVTVCYAIDFDRDRDEWEECETNVDKESSYNTYLHEGITPGPICNFSASCLDAALHPNETENYFFMADVYGDGTIYYAKTFEEHAKNVETYLHY